METPCHGCEFRGTNCHSHCESYRNYKEKHNELGKKIHKEKEKDDFTWKWTVGKEKNRF